MHYGYDGNNFIGVCLIKNNEESSVFKGLELYIIDMFNYIPIYICFIGDKKINYITSFNKSGVSISFDDYFNEYISFDRFVKCVCHKHFGDFNESYVINMNKLINTYCLLSHLFEAAYQSRVKRFNSNQSVNTPLFNAMCEDLEKDIKDIENNYLIEYMEGI